MENEFTLSAFISCGIRRCSLFLLSFGIALLFLVPASASAATTWTVNTVNDSNDGSCTSTTCSLRDAINAANADTGDTIQFAASAFGTIDLTSTLIISKAMTITGPGANLLTISGGGTRRIFYTAAGTVIISGLTLADGKAGSGGAIYVGAGALKVDRCAFIGNKASLGGAIEDPYNEDLYNLTVVNSTFDDNSVTGTGSAGGAIDDHQNVTVVNSTFSGNSALKGGAISAGTFTVVNSTFSGNTAGNGYSFGVGGAIYGTGTSGNDVVENDIFVDNRTGATPSGTVDAFEGGYCYGICTFTEDHNLYYHNRGYDLIDDGYFIAYGSGDLHGTTADPMLLPLGYYGGATETMMPQIGSAAICKGLMSDVTPTYLESLINYADQRGFTLVPSSCLYTLNSNGVDMGAVQTNYVKVTSTGLSGSGTLPWAITQLDPTDDHVIDIGFSGFTTPPTITLSSTLDVPQGSIVIIGPPGGATISGGTGGSTGVQIFNVSDSSTSLSIYGLTLENGYADSSNGVFGGAIGGSLTQAASVTVNVADSTFDNNSEGGNGGAGAISDAGTLYVTGSTFHKNSGDFGAIYSGGSLTVTGSTFYDNSGVASGAITSGPLTATDDTFSGNSASNAGGNGAIFGTTGPETVENDIFANNQEGSGGLGDGYAVYFADSNPTEGNNLFYENYITGTTNESDANVTLSGTDVTGSNPNLAALGNYGGTTETMPPLPESGTQPDGSPEPGSAAICAGTPTLPSPLILPVTDQRGFPRINGSYTGSPCVDIGAVQTNYQSIRFTNIPTDASDNPVPYTETAGQPVNPPAPIVSVTENGQTIPGVSVTLSVGDLTSGVTGNVETTTDPLGSAVATFDSLTVPLADRGYTYTLSSTLDLFTPKSASTPVSITTSPTASLDVSLVVATTTTIVASSSSVVYGNAATFTATVTPHSGSTAPTGTVTFTVKDSGNNIVATSSAETLGTCTGGSDSDSCATYSNSTLDVGSYTVSASYTPFDSTLFSSSSTSSPASVSITQATATASINNLPTDAIVGQSFTPMVVVDPSTDTGAVTVALPASGSDNGICTLGASGLVSFAGPGTCTLDVSVVGSTDYEPVNTTASFTIVSDQVTIQQMVGVVETLNLNGGRKNSLLKELNQAIKMLNRGKISGAINNLQQFIAEAQDLLSSGTLSSADAASLSGLITDAQTVIDALESQL